MTQTLGTGLLDDLRSVLREHGRELAPQELLEECGEEPSLKSVASFLERRGFRARIVSGDAPTSPGEARRLSDRGGALEVLPDWPAGKRFLASMVRHCFTEQELRSALWVFPAAVVALAAVGYGIPALTRRIVDQAIPHGGFYMLGVLSAALLSIGVLQTVLATIKHRAVVVLDTRLGTAAAHALFSHYLGLPLARLQNVTSGEVAQSLSSTLVVIQGFLQHAIAGLASWALCSGYLLWLGTISGKLAAAFAAGTILLVLVMLPWAQRIARLQSEVLKAAARPHDQVLELIDRIRVLRAAGATGWAIARYAHALRREQEASVRLELSSGAFAETLFAVERLAVGGAVLWAASACLEGTHSLGDLFLIVAIVSAYASYQTELLSMLSHALGLRAHLRRIESVFATERVDVPCLALTRREIVVDRVWFRYDESSPWILEDYSLTIPAGGVQSIEWPSGTGKSTLLRLISGLYVPQRGEVRVGGVEARRARDHVAYIPQGCALGAGSMLASLRLLSNEAPMDRILAAAKETGLAEVVASWPMGLDTIISAGGRNISSGQRQLVLLTAALASARPILLMDEATTHIDATLRARLSRCALLQGRTIVNVVHAQRRV